MTAVEVVPKVRNCLGTRIMCGVIHDRTTSYTYTEERTVTPRVDYTIALLLYICLQDLCGCHRCLPCSCLCAITTKLRKLTRHVEAIASPQIAHQRCTCAPWARTSTAAHSGCIPTHTRRSDRAKAGPPIMARHLDRGNNDDELTRVNDRTIQLHKRVKTTK
jgi:hypothetical protein